MKRRSWIPTFVGMTMAVLLTVVVAMGQEKPSWSGIGIGASVTMADGSIDKNWTLEFARITKIYTPVETYLIPQAQYNSKTGVVGVGAGALAVLKRLSWGTFLGGGSILPFEATTSEAIQENNTATSSLELAYTRAWRETFPFIKLKQEWATQLGNNEPVKMKDAKVLTLTVGIVF